MICYIHFYNQAKYKIKNLGEPLYFKNKRPLTKNIKSLNLNKQIIFIKDNNEILKFIHSNIGNIILFQDSELVD